MWVSRAVALERLIQIRGPARPGVDSPLARSIRVPGTAAAAASAASRRSRRIESGRPFRGQGPQVSITNHWVIPAVADPAIGSSEAAEDAVQEE